MAMYGISIMPMIRKLNPSILQKWYADDGSMAGTLPDLLDAFKALETIGKAFGYFFNAPKCQLIVKNCIRKKAERIFKNTEVEITNCTRVLGSVIGERRACAEKTKDFTEKLITMIQKLAKFAKTSPQNAYACLTKGLQIKLTILSRTTPDMHQHFDTIENHIRTELITAITGKTNPEETMRKLFALPLRHGGLNIQHPDHQLNDCTNSCLIYNHFAACREDESQLSKLTIQIRQQNSKSLIERGNQVLNYMDKKEQFTVTLVSEKGSSNWLNALPLKKYGFNMNKSEFLGKLCLRYHWNLERTPEHWAFGEKWTIAHSLHCPKGGYTHLRHNEIRDCFGELLNQVCRYVEIEPKLLPLQGESFASNSVTKDNEARLDIKANGLWESRFNRTFFDVKVFNPHAKSCPKNTKDAYRYNESLKNLKYEKRIVEVEQSSFTPLSSHVPAEQAPTWQSHHKDSSEIEPQTRREF